MNEEIVLEGPLRTWPLGGNPLRYSEITIPFAVARQVIRPVYFDGLRLTGEQRTKSQPHVRKLREEIAAGTYTPASFGAAVTARHLQKLKFEGNKFRLTLSAADPLREVDGGHRFGALLEIREKAKQDGDKALMDLVDSTPITALVYFDGDAKRHFVNLQAGKKVDATQLKIMSGAKKPAGQTALDVARQLHKNPASPFYTHVRFDTQKLGSLPASTIAAEKGDLSLSLTGLVLTGPPEATAEELAQLFIDVLGVLRSRAPDLLGEGMPLAAPPDGTVASATLLVGVSVCVAYRMKAEGTRSLSEPLKARLTTAAKYTFGEQRSISSNQEKRSAIGNFASEFLADLPGEFHHELPVGLVELLKPSSYGLPGLPKKPRGKGAKAPKPADASETEEV